MDDVEGLRIEVYRTLQLAGLPLSDLPSVQASPAGGGVDVVESPELGAVIVGWACSAELLKQAADAIDREEDDHPDVQLQDETEAAMAAAIDRVLRRRGFITSVRADVPGSHQLVVTRRGTA
ncbi:hypothetical protein SHKM778_94760 (plasmid) [Streptomyces sp. KM77-8]|uniref:Uncharacterized protein n=1 Tax=Streptomyces haneummycinicus TaxID=3074435 RepID=A0AAT9HZF9_9ACTN